MFSRVSQYSLTAAVCLLPLALAAQANAQTGSLAIERHLPETPRNAPTEILAPNAVASEQDATPIGPDLRAVVLLGASDPVTDTATDGASVGSGVRLTGAEAQSLLRPWLGQPISRKLIAEIQAAVAGHYRQANHPFVSLSTPEQEISGGVLHIRVIEFTTGSVSVEGARTEAEAAYIRNRVDLQPGDAIDSRALTYDLEWINRYPFRQVQAVFTPGAALGQTDLRLTTRHIKPWQAYAGYNNEGSPSTSLDRYFIGGAVGNLLGRDSLLAAQATVSRDALQGEDDPHYKSLALSYSLPVARHGLIEATANTVETYQLATPFAVRLKANEATLGYRFAVSDLYGDTGMTDFRIGVAAKHQRGITYFTGVNVYDVEMSIYQLYLGYHHVSRNRSVLDVALHLSPGGIGDDNSDAAIALYSQGRLQDARYGYATLTYDRTTPLAGELYLVTRVAGQLSGEALPRTEQAGLGGGSLVRGYSLDDGAYDSALVVRNELQFTPRQIASGMSLSPYLFVDAGYGRDNALDTDTTLVSAGFGADVRLTRYARLNLDAGYALSDSERIKSGDVKVHTNISFVF